MQVSSNRNSNAAASSSRLLIIDADPYMREIVRQQLAVEGFDNVIELGEFADFDKVFSNANPDLILLDVNLPDGNGIDICHSLRQKGFVKPIVMLIAKDAEDDIVPAFEAGANDYITKPLRLGELIALIRTQLHQFNASDDLRFKTGDTNFVLANKVLREIRTERMQALTEKEATILQFLHRAFPAGVTKEELLAEVWGFQNGISTHTLETHIYRLRQKIGRLTEKQIILTIEKGYRLSD